MYKFGNKFYVIFLTFIGISIYVIFASMYGKEFSFFDLLFWGIFAIISETFHIILPSGAATSVGMAVYLAAIVTSNPLVAISLPVVAFLFRTPIVDGKKRHLFTYNYTITLYNISSHVIFIGVITYLYHLFKISPDNYTKIITVSLLLLTLSELLSIVMISIYFATKEDTQRIPLIRSFLSTLPNTWAVGALGLILAFAELEFGKAVVVLFFIPLLLARYSFKLYFDSQTTGQETIEALNAALHYRDAYTAGHTRRVEVYTLMLARKMSYTGKNLERIKTAARLHDIGKIGVPDRILNKPGKLTHEEYQRIKDHSAMGAQILSNVYTLKRVTEIVRQHHERPDGKGYPDGLVGEAINMDASILSIADTYDAMTSKRPYRSAMTNEDAISELRKYRGTQFRSDLVEVFIEALASLDIEELEFEQPKIFEENAEITTKEVVYDH